MARQLRRVLVLAAFVAFAAACSAPAQSPASAPAPTTAPAAPTATATAGAPAADQAGARMVIYTTEINLLAQDLDRLPNQLGELVQAQGGYVAGVETGDDTNKDTGGVRTLVVRLKVPPEHYEATMSSLRALAVEVRSEKATTQDVTEDYSDTQTQITSLEAQHAQLLELMKRTGSVDELLKVQRQADQVRLQIDRLKGHATALERQSALATITVTAQLASAVLEREYVADLAAVRKAEADRSALLAQLNRARNADEEARIRDRLGQAELALNRAQGQLDTVTQQAQRLSLALPQPDQSAPAPFTDDQLARQHLQTRRDLREAELEQQRLTADLQAGSKDATADQLQAAILRTSELSVRLRTLQDRAGQAGVVLPTISSDEEALLVKGDGVSPAAQLGATARRAWSASLNVLTQMAGAIVFMWWVLVPLAVAGSIVVLRRPRRAI